MNGPTPAVAWFLTAVLIEAAVIDGRQRRVPNWLTYHLAAGGLALAAYWAGSAGLLWSLGGLAAGLVLLLPLYAIGGMGAGDVKLLAAVGAWIGPAALAESFAAGVLIGGGIAAAMIARSGWERHLATAFTIGNEVLTLRNPVELSRRAAARKGQMLLLPYGIPLAIGIISHFAWRGLLF